MPKSKASRKITVEIAEKTDKRLELFCFLTNKTKQSAINEALPEYLEKNKRQISKIIDATFGRPRKK